MSPMADVVHQFSLGPLGRCSLAKAAGLGRYKDAASGLNRLRNSGKRNDGAQGDPAITILRIITIPQSCYEPRFRPTMQSFRRIAQQIPCRTNAPHHPHDFGVASIGEPLGLICRLMALF